MLKVIQLAIITSLLLALTSCSVNPVTGKKEVVFMSEEKEIQVGQENDPAIVAAFGRFEDESLQKFIDERGQEMAKISHRPDLPYSFKILDSPVVNAFALPGGYVYFTRGILAHFNNEAEFAGVLGHEIGHVTARHSAKQQTKQTLGQILFIGGLIVSPAFRQFANEGSQFMQLMFLKYSRDNESESDKLGVEYSSAVGYDAHHMANFFNTLSNMRAGTESEALPEFMSTHPDPANRYKRVNEMATVRQAQDPGKEWVVNRNTYLQRIDGMIYGEDPQQGYVDNNTFYHPELLFHFPVPPDWRTNNSPQQLQMAPKDGKAVMILTLGQGDSPDAVAQKIVTDYKLQVVENKKQTLNGMPVVAMVSDQVNEQNGQTIRIMTYVISYNNLIYVMHGMSTKEDFDKYVNQFNGTMRNFKKLTDRSKIDVKPNRLKMMTVRQSNTLQNVLTQAGMKQDQFRELALINGMALTDQVPAGAMVKTIAK